MNRSVRLGADGESVLQVLWQDGDRSFCRGWRLDGEGKRCAVLAVLPTAEHPSPASIDRFAHEYALKDELDGAWAVPPLALVHKGGRTMLVLDDPGGEPLERLLGGSMEIGGFLRLAIGIAKALGKAHERGLVHKDVKPANIIVNSASGDIRLTGFGIATRSLRERQAPEPPETIAGTLAYMAPEQTGRMNRSIDSRTDLYSLGVTLYEMLTGSLPFTASDPMEWVHCHIARQPLAPSTRLENVPGPVSQLVMKLLAKTAEERYQTAAGVERDLQHCLTDWEHQHHIDDFPLGLHDTPDRLLITEKLYGRAREVETLLASFDRIVKSGAPELVLVSGYSGIGKSSVVNELHKALVPPRGLFASGKFDQYKRDIPYSTLVQAFQGLVRPLLGKSDAELAIWRRALMEGLEPNARLMTDLIPELTLIIGDQPLVPELEPRQAQGRFQLVFRRFIGVFARPEHPLALFLDDLQWLDAATLDLLEDLLIRSDLQHLMLIGAYRDNEVDATHPLTRKLGAIKNAGGKIEAIALAPLTPEHLGELISDAVRCEQEYAAPLAELVHEQTAGNPFFVIQFLHSLAEEGLLRFDHDAAAWCWDLDLIFAKGYAENVADLMLGKLTRLPAETQQALQQFACLGNVATIATLSIVLGTPEEQVHAALWPAVRQDLVERLGGSYKFMHDRVQEAAYSLIPEALRAEVHLRIGRLLVRQTPPEKREEATFEIVNQLNRGAALIIQQEERDQLAKLNLVAGRRAKGSTAHASALTYLIAGTELLNDDCWQRNHELIFALELNRAESEFFTGILAAAEERLNVLSSRAANVVQLAAVTCLRADLYTTIGQSSRAVAVGLEFLRHLGVEWSMHPTDEDVRREYDRFWSKLGSRTIEDLIELPLMTDPACLATIDVLTKVGPAAFTEANLHAVAVCWAATLSLERGNSDASCDIYVRLGFIAGERFGDCNAGFRFGKVGYELVERRELTRFQARAYLMFAYHLMPYAKHIRAARDLLHRGFEIANRIGDLMFVGWHRCLYLTENLFAAGDSLVEVQREAERGLALALKMRLGHVIDVIPSHLGLIRTLRGLTQKFGSFDDEEFNEARIETCFTHNPNSAFAECMYYIRKLQAHFHAGEYGSAVEAATKARGYAASRLLFQAADYQFYSALSHAACCDSAAACQRQGHLDALVAHHAQFEVWAENCPENFENRAALVGAERARTEGRDADAMRLYEQAIRSARANSFIHNEALAYELASRFYAARGFEEFARVYLRNARDGYLRWGADGKVRHLEGMYPHLTTEEPAPGPTSTIATPVEQLDLATVIKVSQAVSGEIVLEKMLDTLMRTAIAQAGAERGLLILSHAAEPRIAAEATISGETVLVKVRDAPVTTSLLPETVLHYVLRTRESVILDNAAFQPSFAADPYIRQHETRSILCLPLINQAKLSGVLYLENNLAPRVFASARIAALKLLASQAAIAIENAQLYRDLEQREARIRSLVEAARRSEMELRDVIETVPAMAWTVLPDGSNTFVNRRWAEYTGLSAEDTAGSGWQVAVHPEDVEQYVRKWRASLATGEPFESEARFRGADREYRWFLGRAVPLRDDQGSILRWYGILTDIEDRKRAEALRAGEKRILEMVAKGDSLPHIVDSLCRLVEEHTQDALTSVLLVEDGRLKHVGNPSLPQAYVEAIDGIAIGPTVGSCGTAAHFARHVIVSDIASDPLWADYRDVALPHSLRACWSTPIMSSEGNVIGTFAMYYREPRSPSPRDQEIVEQITHLAGVAIQRTRLYRDLEQREAKIRRLVDANIIGVFVADLEGGITEANDEFLRIVGYEREDLMSGRMRVLDMTPPEWRERTAQTMAEVRFGTIQPYEKEYVRKDGSRVPVLVGSTLFDESGLSVAQGVVFVIDLTELKRAEKALRESDEQWRAVFENNPTMYFMVDKDGVILSVNPYGAEQLGFTVDELIGRPVLNLFHVEDREAVKENTATCFKRGGQTQSWEARKVRNNGEVIWVREIARVVLIKDRPVALIVCEDITERKRVSETLHAVQMELAHANRVATMGQLTASIAHEVNQPIAAVRTNAGAALRFLSGNPPDLEEVSEALGSIVEDTGRAGEIVHRIRALVKKEPLQNARFNVNDAINELIALAQSEVLDKGVTVRLSLAEGLAPVRGDRVQLQQVILNLILNAVQAMSSIDDAPRDLSISTGPTGAHDVLVAVRDSGPGIDPEHRERVFDSFYTTKPSGMGLGLSICRSIVDAHGGQLWAEANEPKGAVFQFTLPATNEDHELPGGLPASTAFETQPARSLPSETTANLRSFLAGGAMLESHPTVLVIDDDPAVRESLGRLLRSVGLDARLFASVPDLLKSERPKGPTCLVVDVKMPERTGLDFQRELAAADVQIPIIFITAHGDVPMSVQAMKRGAIEFLTKPCRDEDLIDAINLGLARDRARCENEKTVGALRAHFESLSPREREVMIQVVQGRLSKQIAHDIGTSEQAVNFHRCNLMRKLNVRSLPELCRMADKLKLLSEMT